MRLFPATPLGRLASPNHFPEFHREAPELSRKAGILKWFNFMLIPIIFQEPIDYLLLLAVWDGHGGSECSEFCAAKVEKYLLRQIRQQSQSDEEQKFSLSATLRETILELNRGFERHWAAKAKMSGAGKRSPGTTATIALIRDGYELAVAHVGDSRAYLCRGGEARRLTKDHCPSEPGR